MQITRALLGAIAALSFTCSFTMAQEKQGVSHVVPAWVQRSNENAKVLLDLEARYNPEGAQQSGVDGVDEQIFDLKPNREQRYKKDLLAAIEELQSRLAKEKDEHVRQDLAIMIDNAKKDIHGIDLSERLEIPYFDMNRTVFYGLRSLLDDQIAPERRKAALVRLRKYAGMEEGYTPVTKLAEAHIAEKLNLPGRIGPFKGELETDLANGSSFISGIEGLFKKYGITGYEEPLAKLKAQLAEYNDFVRAKVLPKARTDFRLPPELYAYSLERVGVDLPPQQLADVAHAAFNDIQKEMQALAPKIASQRGWKSTDYRDVIRELKKEQWTGESILANYKKRIGEIEDIIRREKLVTLPSRPMRIRLASEAESAAVPAPNMRPPRLIGNTGEAGEFVLPLSFPSKEKGKEQKFDDFTYAAASWTLTAHEGRPGHELQFDAMVENGISIARALYAFNSTNVEGWGLYAEKILLPYMPLEGQLVSLQFRLHRAARAFLDPELQMGKVTPEQAHKVLTDDVVLSDAMATSEVQRYTFRSPGQATSYFYGYTKLVALRSDVEKALGKKFDAHKFHDFILSQGLLPPNLLRKAVMDQFVPEMQGNKVARLN
ncbi:MAG TPA: DUF885 domain-containing protein [Terriglobales bacterium]|nr:DUF885 domain-containing protein [Terriglobales bacterium]